MKQKLYTAGLANLIIILTGAIFKINHFPGAGILLTSGIIAFVIVFIPAALISNYRQTSNSRNRILYIVTGITCFVVFTAMLFKIMHWPFAGNALMIGIIFPYAVFLPVFLFITSRNSNISIYHIVFVLFLLALSSVFNALLSLNVGRNIIEDSMNVSENINIVKTSLLRINQDQKQSEIARKIDETLLVIDQYQEMILKNEGLTEDEWNNNPGSLFRPDSRNAVSVALHKDKEMEGGIKLKDALNSLVKTALATPGYEALAKALTYFAELPSSGGNVEFYNISFTEDYISWSLVYLDSLETNLRLIRSTI